MNQEYALKGATVSTSQFPNANEQRVEELIRLSNDLLSKSSDPMKTTELGKLIVLAYMCAALEAILHSSEIKLYCPPYDRLLVREIEDTLNDCR